MTTRMLVTVATACCLATATAFADDDHGRTSQTYQTTNLFMMGNPGIMRPGAATMYRGRHGVDVRVAAGGLQMNTSYSVWWVIFNNPSACSMGACGSKDFANPDVRASVTYAAGFVTGAGDTGNVTAHLDAGVLPDGVDVQLGDGLSRGNGLRARSTSSSGRTGSPRPGSWTSRSGRSMAAARPRAATSRRPFSRR